MEKLGTALLNAGFVVKKIEDEKESSFIRNENGEKYTGQIIIVARPADEETAELEVSRLRKEREFTKGAAASDKSRNEEAVF
jgi:hypothetical protein